MLDEKGIQTLFQQTHDLWIQPELNRRFSETGIPIGFQIRECLIKQPKDQPPIVEFNDEIHWLAQNPQLASGRQMEVGQIIFLHDLIHIGKIQPPMVDGKRVAFVWLYWSGFSYKALFDFSPNSPDFDPEQNDFQYGEIIADHLMRKMTEMSVKGTQVVQAQLRQIGLWPVTCLLPYPISKIVERVGEGHPDEARAILVQHCNTEFIENLVETWMPIQVFSDRIEIFREAVFAHNNRKYISAIHTLIPQVEGVITDWLYTRLNPEDIKFKPESKIKQFREEIETIPQLEFMWRASLESALEFLLDGPPMQQFKKWLDAIDPSFPGRHPVAHGKFVGDIFNEENSIKLLLLLDTICQFMMFYEVRKLGKNLGQNEEADA